MSRSLKCGKPPHRVWTPMPVAPSASHWVWTTSEVPETKLRLGAFLFVAAIVFMNFWAVYLLYRPKIKRAQVSAFYLINSSRLYRISWLAGKHAWPIK